jgi:uncharacterized membrane protein YbhN (UPF0104 family)
VKSRKLLSLLAALAATLVVGYFVVRQLKWADLVALERSSDLRFLSLGFGAYFCANLLRAARFRALTGDRIPSASFLRTVIIQNLLNTFLPLRAGEASYLYMVHRSGVVKPGENIGSLLGARILDLLAALLIPALSLPLSKARGATGVPPLALLAVPLLGIALFALSLRKAEVLASFCASRANGSRIWVNRGLSLGSDVLRSLSQLRGSSLLGRVTLLTASAWTLLYLSGYFSLIGIGLALPFFDCMFAYGFPVIISMMPFYMLGGFGVFEGTIGVGLNLVGVPLGLATAAGLALHVAELLFIVVPGPLTLVSRLWPAEPARGT